MGCNVCDQILWQVQCDKKVSDLIEASLEEIAFLWMIENVSRDIIIIVAFRETSVTKKKLFVSFYTDIL